MNTDPRIMTAGQEIITVTDGKMESKIIKDAYVSGAGYLVVVFE